MGHTSLFSTLDVSERAMDSSMSNSSMTIARISTGKSRNEIMLAVAVGTSVVFFPSFRLEMVVGGLRGMMGGYRKHYAR